MSGGSMNYLYSQVAEVEFSRSTPLRRAFWQHLMLVADAMHDIEWVDSGDSGNGDEEEAIQKVFAHASTHPQLSVLIAEASALRDALDAVLPPKNSPTKAGAHDRASIDRR